MKRNQKNRYYPPEFKEEALKLLASGEFTMAQLERDLGITAGLLKQWQRKVERDDQSELPEGVPKTAKAAAARIKQLERENLRLRQERDILKKAMAIFSNPKD